MKSLNTYIQEKLIVNKDYTSVLTKPKNFKALRQIIMDRYDNLGPGTESSPIDFNDIDVSGIKSLGYGYRRGIFAKTNFEYIDISDWKIPKIYESMFYGCKELKNIKLPPTITRIDNMAFCGCNNLTNIYINKNITYIDYGAFEHCESLKTVYVDDIDSFDKIFFSNTVSDPRYYGAEIKVI